MPAVGVRDKVPATVLVREVPRNVISERRVLQHERASLDRTVPVAAFLFGRLRLDQFLILPVLAIVPVLCPPVERLVAVPRQLVHVHIGKRNHLPGFFTGNRDFGNDLEILFTQERVVAIAHHAGGKQVESGSKRETFPLQVTGIRGTPVLIAVKFLPVIVFKRNADRCLAILHEAILVEREADCIARLIELGSVRHDRFCAFDKVGADFGTINKALEPFAVFKRDGVAVLDKQNLFEHIAIIRDSAHPETARVLFRRQDDGALAKRVHARRIFTFNKFQTSVLGNRLDTRIAGAFHALFSIAPHGIQFLGILELFIQFARPSHSPVRMDFRILLGRPTEHARIRRVYPCRQTHLVIVVQDLQGIALDKIKIVEHVFLFRV